jgi:Raf kinase inhibitor-like YbhB/YbcL family protein
MTSLRTFALSAVGATLLLSSCLSDGRTMQPPTPEQKAAFVTVTTVAPALGEGGDEGTAMSVTGPWVNGTAIDARYTCDGAGISPQLAWTSGPAETKAFGIVLRDNDAPNFVHWVLTNLDPTERTIGEGALPQGAFMAVNGSGKQSYAPPCPATGSSHSYTMTVYALGSRIAVNGTTSAAHVMADMEASVLEVATTDFVYSR